MASYYVNPEPDKDGDNEVHQEGCHRMPARREYLGEFSNCHEAVAAAKRRYPNADGCGICSPACHLT
jgi:hypothetical protein